MVAAKPPLRGGLGNSPAPAPFVARVGGPLPKRYRPPPRPKKKDLWRDLEQFQAYLRLREAVPLWVELEGAYRFVPECCGTYWTLFCGGLAVCRAKEVVERVKALQEAGHVVCRIRVLEWAG